MAEENRRFLLAERPEGPVDDKTFELVREPVPRPPHWGGYVVAPYAIEFWQAGDFRLHDRFVFARAGEGWTVERLSP